MRASAMATHRREFQVMDAIGIALPNRDMVVWSATLEGVSGRVFLSSGCLFIPAALLTLLAARSMARSDTPSGRLS